MDKQTKGDRFGESFQKARDTLDILWNVSKENRDIIASNYGTLHPILNGCLGRNWHCPHVDKCCFCKQSSKALKDHRGKP